MFLLCFPCRCRPRFCQCIGLHINNTVELCFWQHIPFQDLTHREGTKGQCQGKVAAYLFHNNLYRRCRRCQMWYHWHSLFGRHMVHLVVLCLHRCICLHHKNSLEQGLTDANVLHVTTEQLPGPGMRTGKQSGAAKLCYTLKK